MAVLPFCNVEADVTSTDGARRAADRLDRRGAERARPDGAARRRHGRGGARAPCCAGASCSYATSTSRRASSSRSGARFGALTPGPPAAGRARRRPSRGPRAGQPRLPPRRRRSRRRYQLQQPLAHRRDVLGAPAAGLDPGRQGGARAVGGDTLWADLVAAYRTLSPGIRALVDPLVAVHDAARTFDRFQDERPGARRRAGARSPPGRAGPPGDRRARACS